MELGTWTGGMYPPAPLTPQDATFDVEMVDGTLDIKIHQPGGIIPTQKAVFDGDAISFQMRGPGRTEGAPMRTIVCRLEKKADSTFEGTCIDDSVPAAAPQGRLVMIPPSQG